VEEEPTTHEPTDATLARRHRRHHAHTRTVPVDALEAGAPVECFTYLLAFYTTMAFRFMSNMYLELHDRFVQFYRTQSPKESHKSLPTAKDAAARAYVSGSLRRACM
jgi:hypothetical protein